MGGFGERGRARPLVRGRPPWPQSLAGELVLDHDTVAHPHLADAPAGHLVGVSRHAHADDNTIAS